MSVYPDFDSVPIGKRWRAGSSEENRTSIDPWNGDTLATISQADADDLDETSPLLLLLNDWAPLRGWPEPM